MPPTTEGPEAPFDISEDDLKRAIWRLAINKAPGADGVTAKVARSAWRFVSIKLLAIAREILASSCFPNIWKEAKIVVLRKGRDKDPVLP